MIINNTAAKDQYYGPDLIESYYDNTIVAQQYINDHSPTLTGLERTYGWVCGSILHGYVLNDGVIYNPLYVLRHSEQISLHRSTKMPHAVAKADYLKHIKLGYIHSTLTSRRGVFIIHVLRFKDEVYIHLNGQHGLFINSKWVTETDVCIPDHHDVLRRHLSGPVYKALCTTLNKLYIL